MKVTIDLDKLERVLAALEDARKNHGLVYIEEMVDIKEALSQPEQEPSTRPCRSCGGTGERFTGIDEAPTSICKPCNGTGQIALAQPEQEPTCPECKAAVLYECVACSSNNYPPKPVQPAIKQLKSVLCDLEGKCCIDGSDEDRAIIDRAFEALAQPEQEPVAWMVYTQDGQSVYVTDNPTDFKEGQRALPLYTTPAQRKPLTNEQITQIYTKWESTKGTSWADLMRAIEAAHGIKENT